MAWKCKKCGSEDIGLEVWGRFTGYETGFDKNGNGSIDITDLSSEDCDKYTCENCGETADRLKDLADWEDE